MRVGSICYATSRGLGHLCRDFYLHGVVTDVLVVRHPGVPTNEDWYPGAPAVPLRGIEAHRAELMEFVAGMDAMLFFETPFWWPILPFCHDNGVRTYLVTMYECYPVGSPPPTRYICPSLLDLDYFPEGVFLPLPVEYPWRLRERALHYVHNGGYLGVRGREGTENLINAMQYVRSPLKLTIRVQENVSPEAQRKAAYDGRIEYLPATVPYYDLYGSGDVAVGAQRWNGCSLPLQEARASGMLVMNTDRYPMNTWLPNGSGNPTWFGGANPLIPVGEYRKTRVADRFPEIDEAIVSPRAIAAKMDEWFGRDISDYSRSAVEWARSISWAALAPKYLEVLAS